jgi:hypothetical protein
MWSDTRLDERFDAIDRRQLWGTNMVAILVTLVAVIVTRS